MRNSFGLQTKRCNGWLTRAIPQPRTFGGKPGEPVPEVDAEDLKAVWQVQCEIEAQRPGQPAAIGLELMACVCTPRANVAAVFYRISMLTLLTYFAPDKLSP
jgi:hypothetical protein